MSNKDCLNFGGPQTYIVNRITFISRFTTCGRVTIPAPLRKMYGLKPGTKVVLAATPSGDLLLKLPANFAKIYRSAGGPIEVSRSKEGPRKIKFW